MYCLIFLLQTWFLLELCFVFLLCLPLLIILHILTILLLNIWSLWFSIGLQRFLLPHLEHHLNLTVLLSLINKIMVYLPLYFLSSCICHLFYFLNIFPFDCTKTIPETLTLCFLYSLTYHFFTVLYICEVLFFQVRWFQLSTSPLNFTYPPSYWSLMLFWRYILLYALNPIIMSLFMDYLYYCIRDQYEGGYVKFRGEDLYFWLH